jgi:anti-anti-sigma factor
MPLLELTVDRQGDVVRLALAGEDTSPPVLVLDLRGLKFMDSTGLRIVVSANARAESAERRFVVVRGPEPVHRIFRITRLEERLDMVDDAAELETA